MPTAKDEWGTPAQVVYVARKILGGKIALDPASSAAANRTVRATRYYNAEMDGLTRPWAADSLFLNPPFSKPKPWYQRLVAYWESGHVKAAVAVLADRGQSTEAGCRLLHAASAICIPDKRVHFVGPDGLPGASPDFGVILVAGGRELDLKAALRHFGLLGSSWVRL